MNKRRTPKSCAALQGFVSFDLPASRAHRPRPRQNFLTKFEPLLLSPKTRESASSRLQSACVNTSRLGGGHCGPKPLGLSTSQHRLCHQDPVMRKHRVCCLLYCQLKYGFSYTKRYWRNRVVYCISLMHSRGSVFLPKWAIGDAMTSTTRMWPGSIGVGDPGPKAGRHFDAQSRVPTAIWCHYS